MLAERRKREKWSLNPRGNFWSNDANKFGQQILEKMGWKPGRGLGAKEQGITEQIKVTCKSDKTCIGFREHGQEWTEQQSQFENLLAQLSNSHDAAVSDKKNESLELRSRHSRARVHYQKFTRGKDLSNYSDKDLACILGVKTSSGITGDSNITESKNNMNTFIGKVDNLYGVTTVNGGNMNDYFIKKKRESVDTAPEDSQAEKLEERVESEVGYTDCTLEIVSNKKQKHKNTGRSDSQEKKLDGPETKENELTFNDGSADGSGCKRKMRKINEEANEGTYLQKKDERGDKKTDSEQYCKKTVYHLEEKGNSFTQKCTTKKKRKEEKDMAGKEVWQETGGNELNDSTNCFNYKRKKRKLVQVGTEHLPKEKEIIKQDGLIHVEELYNEGDMNTSEVKNNKVKRKKKQKEKDTDFKDVHRKEVETDRNARTLLNGDSRSDLNCMKKKTRLKQEVKVTMEDEVTEQGKKISEFDNFVPKMYYPSKNKCERNSSQVNGGSVDHQDVAITVDNMVHKKESPRKRKHCRNSVDRNTEVDNSEKKDHEIVEEETRKHKSKKKKNRKHTNDEKTSETEEHELEQYNLEETEAASCDRKNSEELSVTCEAGLFVNCRNNVGKEKKRKGKNQTKRCATVELECEKDDRIQKQDDTDTNGQKSITAIQNDKTQNIEDSKQATNNTKQKQEFCNSSVQKNAGANIEGSDIKKIDISRRHMRPSVFAHFLDPSLITFKGSNLHRIPGYGNC